MRTLGCVITCLFLASSLQGQVPRGRVVDLTYTFDEQTIYWPTEAGFKFEKGFEGVTPNGFYYTANRFCTPEHGGTHIDAPIHFAAGKNTVDQIPVDQLIGEAVLVDVKSQCAKDRDYRITKDDLTQWERRNGRIPRGAIVLFRTGFGAYWPDRIRYLGTEERGQEAVAKLHFPGLHQDAASWLIAQRAVKAVGLDTASIDYGQSTHFETHVTLMTANVPALENVANLDGLPAKGFSIVALPVKIKGGSGGPVRIIAFVRGR